MDVFDGAVAMRVLELTYTSNHMVGFAADLGGEGRTGSCLSVSGETGSSDMPHGSTRRELLEPRSSPTGCRNAWLRQHMS